MEFINCSPDTPEDYKKFIMKHKYTETKKNYWVDIAKSGKKVIPYCNSMVSDEDTIVYFEFVDEDLNIYVEFFEEETKKWLYSYMFKDDDLSWTIMCDNFMYGNPLGLKGGTK